VISSRDNERLKLVRKLHDRKWRDKLGLFVVEGEDLLGPDDVDPTDLLVAGEDVEPALLAEVSTLAHPPRVIAVYRREDLPQAEFRFSQDEDRDTVIEIKRGASEISGWMPTYLDYLYVSLTNSSAFSPTDCMPLSHRAKLLMGTEATAALITSVVVIAKGVGSLS